MPTTLQYLKEIATIVKKYFIYLFTISMIIAVAVFFWVKNIRGYNETYSKIFPLSINKSASGPLDAIKSQFGISDKTDYDKIYNVNELVNSKTISNLVVKASPSNKQYPNFAHWIIEDYNSGVPFYQSKIVLNPKDSGAYYFSAANILLKNTSIVSEKTDFTSINTKAYDKELAKELNLTILEQLSKYYISLSTEKPRNDLNKIKIMRDSLKEELYAIERAVAGFQDANQMSVKYLNNIPQAKLLRTRIEVEQLYSTTSAAYQNARFKLLSESPIFQILDYPGEPYDFIKPSSKNYAIGAFMISFIVLLLFSCRKLFWKMILEELAKS